MATRCCLSVSTKSLAGSKTESANDKGEEFAEPCLIEGLGRHRELPAEALLASFVGEVRQFSSGDQQDDITLNIANCR